MKPPAARPDDVIAVLAETAALTRAGIPLEAGLANVSADLPSRLSALAEKLRQRLADGTPLPEVLAEAEWGLPPEYVAVVAAGARSGRMSQGLERVVEANQQMRELKHLLRQSLIYPLLVLLLAYGVWLGVMIGVMPHVEAMYVDVGAQPHWIIRLFAPWARTWRMWAPVLPLALLVAWLASRAWFRQPWASAASESPGWSWLPRMRRVRQLAERARFAETLSILLGYDVPLTEALGLAARASGSAALLEFSESMVARIAAGEAIGTAWPRDVPFSPVVRWLLISGGPQPRLVAALAHAAGTYRNAARREAELARLLWPVWFTLGLGASVALVCAVSLFWPVTDLYHALAAY